MVHVHQVVTACILLYFQGNPGVPGTTGTPGRDGIPGLKGMVSFLSKVLTLIF